MQWPGGLADSRRAEQDDIAGFADVGAGGQVRQDVPAQGRLVIDVEVLQRLDLWEACSPSADLDAGGFAVGDLAAQDRGQVLLIRPSLFTGGVGEIGEHTGNGRCLEDPSGIGDLGRGFVTHADTSEPRATPPGKSTS